MMITRHEGHGGFAKQFLKEGSMGGIMKVSHLHSHHAYSSGEILSPRSVLEQRALSGLAIALDLEEKMKLSPHTQEHVIMGRFSSKQSVMHMSAQVAHGKENLTMGRFLSRERLSYMMCMNHDEREALTGETSVGLKMVISMHQVSNQEGKEQEKHMMGSSLSTEKRMRQMMHEEKEGEAVSGGSNGGFRVGASLGGESKQDNVCTADKTVRATPSEECPPASSCQRSSHKNQQSTWWLHQLGCVQQSIPACTSPTEDSIFYYAAANPPPPPSSHHHHHVVDDDGRQACSLVEDFLQWCYFCKRRLGAGKDIYMYRRTFFFTFMWKMGTCIMFALCAQS